MAGILKFNNVEVFGSDGKVTSAGMPSGSIVQVQYTQYGTGSGEEGNMTSLGQNTDYVLQASGNTSGGAQSGILDVNITPKITGSKIWLQCHWIGEVNTDRPHDLAFYNWRSASGANTKLASYNHSSGADDNMGITQPTRTFLSEDAGATLEVANWQYFDAHGISVGTQITYKVGFTSVNSGITALATNKVIDDDDATGVSSLVAIEIAP